MRNVDSKIKSPQFDRYVILIPQIVRGDFFDSIGQTKEALINAAMRSFAA